MVAPGPAAPISELPALETGRHSEMSHPPSYTSLREGTSAQDDMPLSVPITVIGADRATSDPSKPRQIADTDTLNYSNDSVVPNPQVSSPSGLPRPSDDLATVKASSDQALARLKDYAKQVSDQASLISQLRAENKVLQDKIGRLEQSKEGPSRAGSRNAREFDDIQRLKSDLQQEKRQHASLRAHLQLAQDPEPRQVVEDFGRLTRAIDDYAFNLSGAVCQRVENCPKTTRDADSAALAALFHTGDTAITLAHGRDNDGRPTDAFLEYGLRHLISSEIYAQVFRPFHPDLYLHSPEHSSSLSAIYNQIRLDQPQIVAGRWRANAFAAAEKLVAKEKNPIDVVATISHHIETTIVHPLFDALFGSTAQVHLSSEESNTLYDNVRNMYQWNRNTKLFVLLLDYHPTLTEIGDQFERDSMIYLGCADNETPPISMDGHSPAVVTVLSMAGLGLQSTKALGNGKIADVMQTKIVVLDEGFFER